MLDGVLMGLTAILGDVVRAPRVSYFHFYYLLICYQSDITVYNNIDCFLGYSINDLYFLVIKDLN